MTWKGKVCNYDTFLKIHIRFSFIHINDNCFVASTILLCATAVKRVMSLLPNSISSSFA
jgi:hypothetical protein